MATRTPITKYMSIGGLAIVGLVSGAMFVALHRGFGMQGLVIGYISIIGYMLLVRYTITLPL